MLEQKEQGELKILVESKLDHAEKIWNKVGFKMMAENVRAGMECFSIADIDTQIPGYPTISIDKPEVDEFIALVADMRNSTEHLLVDISKKRADVTMLQRVFYETSALLPVLAKTISYKNGSVTEYLGDGILGLFKASKAQDEKQCIYDAHNASKKCLHAVEKIVNPSLEERYRLPPLEIGIGLAFSRAVVTMTGIDKHYQPKVFGECVYRATKISDGKNKICIDGALHKLWPTSKGGTLRFIPYEHKGRGGFSAYEIAKN